MPTPRNLPGPHRLNRMKFERFLYAMVSSDMRKRLLVLTTLVRVVEPRFD